MVRPFLSSNFGNYGFFEQGEKFARYCLSEQGRKDSADFASMRIRK